MTIGAQPPAGHVRTTPPRVLRLFSIPLRAIALAKKKQANEPMNLLKINRLQAKTNQERTEIEPRTNQERTKNKPNSNRERTDRPTPGTDQLHSPSRQPAHSGIAPGPVLRYP
jgi:hypothetical protein